MRNYDRLNLSNQIRYRKVTLTSIFDEESIDDIAYCVQCQEGFFYNPILQVCQPSTNSQTCKAYEPTLQAVTCQACNDITISSVAYKQSINDENSCEACPEMCNGCTNQATLVNKNYPIQSTISNILSKTCISCESGKFFDANLQRCTSADGIRVLKATLKYYCSSSSPGASYQVFSEIYKSSNEKTDYVFSLDDTKELSATYNKEVVSKLSIDIRLSG